MQQSVVDVQEYLRTSFEADCEFVDGKVVERNAGELSHSNVLGTLCLLLHRFRKRLGVRVLPIIRIRIHSERYRVADVAVWLRDDIGTAIPTVRPFLVVEVLSADDRMVPMVAKIHEYLSIGVEWVWVVDTLELSAIVYSQANPQGTVCDILRTENPEIAIPLADAFNLDA